MSGWTSKSVIPSLRVANAADAVAWYERLGFTQEWEHRIEPGWPAFVSIARGRSMNRSTAEAPILSWVVPLASLTR
jgi:hypothetical protein